ncbi:MAG: hypothetical protein ACRDOH_22180 [Streptosporangiaceae bacterium]
MGEQTDGRPADRGQRFTDRGERFGRRRFLGKAGVAVLAVGTGVFVAGCEFNHGPNQGSGTGQSSTSGQTSTSGPGGSHGQGSSGSQSSMSS